MYLEKVVQRLQEGEVKEVRQLEMRGGSGRGDSLFYCFETSLSKPPLHSEVVLPTCSHRIPCMHARSHTVSPFS